MHHLARHYLFRFFFVFVLARTENIGKLFPDTCRQSRLLFPVALSFASSEAGVNSCTSTHMIAGACHCTELAKIKSKNASSGVCVHWQRASMSLFTTLGLFLNCRYSDNNTDKTVSENYDCLAVKVTELKETIKPAKGDFLWYASIIQRLSSF